MRRPTAYHPAALVLIALSFGSCATLLNKATQPVYIAKNTNIRHVSVDSSVRADTSFPGPDCFVVRRSRQPIVLHFDTDTGRRTVALPSHTSVAFWANIYFNYGLGILVDYNNPKRYSYPRHLAFSQTDGIVRRRRFAPVDKGVTRITAGLSLINDNIMHVAERKSSTAGVLGLEIGADHFYQKNQYLSFSAGTGIRGPSFVEHFGPWTRITRTAYYFNVRNNHVVGSFDLGYGLAISRLSWQKTTVGITPAVDTLVHNTGLGLSFNAEYRLGEYCRLGVLYQPGTWSSQLPGNFNYQHFFSLRLLWRIPLNGR